MIWGSPAHPSIQVQTLEVRPDPRVRLASQDYLDAFSLARRVEAARLRISQASDQAKVLHKQITAAILASQDDGRKARLTVVDRRLLEVADAGGDATPGEPASGLLPVGSLRRIAADLDALGQAVDGADAAPSPDARAGLDAALARLDGALARLAAVSTEADAILAV
jgi:hypothetical protein